MPTNPMPSVRSNAFCSFFSFISPRSKRGRRCFFPNFPLTQCLLALLFPLLTGLPASAQGKPDIAKPLAAYDVSWDVPGPTSAESMPLGNGDLGLNVWVEPGGDLLFYIGKSDAWDEDVPSDHGLMKLGKVRVSVKPTALAPGAPFTQVLKLHDGEIQVHEGSGPDAVLLRVWVDANHPVIRVEAKSAGQPISLAVSLEDWRLTQRNPDVIVPGQTNQIVWYHRNGSAARHVANLTFGGVIKGKSLVSTGATTLESSAKSPYQLVSIYPLAAATETPEQWLAELAHQAAGIDSLKLESTRAEHQKWWSQFWSRSWIFLRGDHRAAEVDRGYILQRFVTACAGRGAYPIKFNGSLFIVDDPAQPQGNGRPPRVITADSRTWGGQYWFQNTRPMYWPCLEAGDFEMMLPLFKMYAAMLPANSAQVTGYYHHQGAYFAETAPFWGGLRYWGPEVREDWTGHYFTPILELSMMMFDYYEFTGDKQFARDTLLPVASAGIQFFDQHFGRDDQGKLLLDPDNSIEMYWKVHDPAPDIAGLHAILARLLALPGDLATPANRAAWQKLLTELPDLPTGIRNGKTALLPYTGPQTARSRNGENPELYAIYPFRLYGNGKPDLQLALDTFNTRRQKQMGCWVQDPVQAAMIGLADVARQYLTYNFTDKEPRLKFPAFWARKNDYAPDEDNGGNGQHALQQMLLQTDGRKLILLPAWPQGWDADFKLNAPFQTTVQGTVQNGKLVNLVVTPRSRRADVLDFSTNPPPPVVLAANPPPAEPESHPVRVACVGDSIVYGAGIANRDRNSWPAVLGGMLGDNWSVRNFGLNSTTMLKKGDLPYRDQPIFNQALNFKPDIFIISLGANDSKHPGDTVKDAVNNWQYKSDFTGDYKAMIAAFKAANPAAKIYVCIPLPAYPGNWGINDTTIREEITPLVRQVAQETGSTVIDLYTALSGKPELFPDTVHPNAAGAHIVAATVYQALTGAKPSENKPAAAGNSTATNAAIQNLLTPQDAIVPLKQTTKGKANVLAVNGDFGGDGSGEPAASIIDGNLDTKYFNKGQDTAGGTPGVDTGFMVTPAAGSTVVTAIQFATANDMPERDPVRITIEGSNDPQANNFNLLYEGPSGLDHDPDRTQWGKPVTFANTTPYKTYRVLVTATRANADAVQYAEVKLGVAPVSPAK